MTYNDDNIFAKILNKKLSTDIILENEHVIAFHDIAPQAPIHILIGDKDDWTPALACEELVDSLNDKKENINITIYENSYHGFDSDRPYTFVEHGYSFTECRFTIRDDGAPLMNFLNIPMTSPTLQKIGLSFCVSRGVTLSLIHI